jgi:hypothetical protein
MGFRQDNLGQLGTTLRRLNVWNKPLSGRLAVPLRCGRGRDPVAQGMARRGWGIRLWRLTLGTTRRGRHGEARHQPESL